MKMNKQIILKGLLAFLLIFQSLTALAFTVKNIRVQGLGRIRKETVLSYVPVRPGQDFDRSQSRALVQSLFKTGFFDNVRVLRHGDTLIIRVVERPIIGALRVRGNKLIKTKDIEKVLKENGVAEGLVYDQGKFRSIRIALEQQYYNLGRYNAKISTDIQDEGKGRIAIGIEIFEGQNATIKRIKIIGNKAYSESKLMHNFQLAETHLWSPIFHSNQYSREKMNADLEALRSYYMDRGYIDFKIESVQVSITPDKRDVFITVNILEGPVYHLRKIDLQGNVGHDRADILRLITLRRGDVFSRRQIVEANKALNNYYLNKGFAYAHINIVPNVDQRARKVDISFSIQPDHRVYVRHIRFEGNTRTQDEVLRREMRQFEGALYDDAKLNLSKRKINNLGFVEKVSMNREPVPGHKDQMDIVYKMSEASTASARAQVGYSDAVGLLFGAGLNQKNFLGTGRSIGINVERNDAYRTVNLSYFNPYATINGIGHGYNFFYNQTTPGKIGIANYSTDSLGGNVHFSFPISDFNYLTLSAGYTRLNFKVNPDKISRELLTFVKTNGVDCDPSKFPPSFFTPPFPTETNFDQFTLTFGWTDTNFDRAIFPTEGFRSALSLQIGLPFTNESIDYYKFSWHGSVYRPLRGSFVLHGRANFGYGNSFGRLNCLPFFLNYHAGGMDTVRSLDDNSLGPLDSRGKPLGGNLLTTTGLELIFPNPLGEKVRSSLFMDAGNVFDNQFAFSDIHLSGGMQIDWISPFGPLRFALGYPLIRFNGDKPKAFQFSMGTSI